MVFQPFTAIAGAHIALFQKIIEISYFFCRRTVELLEIAFQNLRHVQICIPQKSCKQIILRSGIRDETKAIS